MKGGRFASAMSMMLYALEICLKDRVCAALDLGQLPRAFEIHDLENLLILSGLSSRIEKRDPATTRVRKNWEQVIGFVKPTTLNDLRYSPDSRWTRSDAETLWSQMVDPPDEIIPWFSNQP